jgi:hypothetical protein
LLLPQEAIYLKQQRPPFSGRSLYIELNFDFNFVVEFVAVQALFVLEPLEFLALCQSDP